MQYPFAFLGGFGGGSGLLVEIFSGDLVLAGDFGDLLLVTLESGDLTLPG